VAFRLLLLLLLLLPPLPLPRSCTVLFIYADVLRRR